MPNNRIFLFLIFILLLSVLLSISCQTAQPEAFGIYLADTDELVLSEQHIKVFHSDDYSFELNEKGIEKWNSYLVYPDIPKLKDCLYGEDFILKIEGKEICRGKFWSMVSSSTCDGIVILDALLKLDNDFNKLWIESGYPGSYGGPMDTAISSELIHFFDQHHLLK